MFPKCSSTLATFAMLFLVALSVGLIIAGCTDSSDRIAFIGAEPVRQETLEQSHAVFVDKLVERVVVDS